MRKTAFTPEQTQAHPGKGRIYTGNFQYNGNMLCIKPDFYENGVCMKQAYIERDGREQPMSDTRKKMTLIVFSNDMDKAMGAFILATGAASSGMDVTMFFTFWGLSLLRKPAGSGKSKPLVEKLFGWMLPKGPRDTGLSKMHFLGAGTAMMKGVMKTKKMPRLEELMDMAGQLGVKRVACTTSMSMMGITRDELADGIDIGGVATYLGEAGDANVNLFI